MHTPPHTLGTGVIYSASQVIDVFHELDINQDGLISTSEFFRREYWHKVRHSVHVRVRVRVRQ